MQVIKAAHLGMPNPLMEAKRFILGLCDGMGIPIELFPKCSVTGIGYIAPGIEYQVEIALDGDEIHAYFRYARPSMWRFPVIEITFFTDDNPSIEKTAA